MREEKPLYRCKKDNRSRSKKKIETNKEGPKIETITEFKKS